jgi:hypothetical protein
MRNLAIAAGLAAALLAGSGAGAQQPSPLPPALRAPGSDDVSAIRGVTVLDIGSLPPQVRLEVDNALAQTSPDELRELRAAIDKIPKATQALRAKGMSSAEIIAVALDDDGDLALIAQATI